MVSKGEWREGKGKEVKFLLRLLCFMKQEQEGNE